MKKVLLGLLALSAVSMAVDFQKGTVGELTVTGTLKSEAPQVTYKLYATDGTTTETELKLPEFLIKERDSLEGGFKDVPNKVVVKKVVNGVETALTPADNLKFRVQVDPTFTSVNTDLIWLEGGSSVVKGIPITATLGNTALEKLISDLNTELGSDRVTKDLGWGMIKVDGTAWDASSSLLVSHQTLGELEVTSKVPKSSGVSDIPEGALIVSQFQGGLPITGVTVQAKVD